MKWINGSNSSSFLKKNKVGALIRLDNKIYYKLYRNWNSDVRINNRMMRKIKRTHAQSFLNLNKGLHCNPLWKVWSKQQMVVGQQNNQMCMFGGKLTSYSHCRQNLIPDAPQT